MKRTKHLLLGCMLAMVALCAPPAAIAQTFQPMAGYTAHKAAAHTVTMTTASQAEHAAASEPAARTCACSLIARMDPDYNSPLVAAEVDSGSGIAVGYRDPGDENDNESRNVFMAGTGGGDDGERLPLAA